jgi:hypothetical protein
MHRAELSIWGEIKLNFILPHMDIRFIEETVLFSLCVLGTLVKSKLTINVWFVSGLLIVFHYGQVWFYGGFLNANLMLFWLQHSSMYSSGIMSPALFFCFRLLWVFGVFCGFICMLGLLFIISMKNEMNFADNFK